MAQLKLKPEAKKTLVVDSCAECLYWVKNDKQGVCRRYPPNIPRAQYLSAYPETMAHDWCGEFVHG